jgi:hypothetical protein
MNDDSAEGHERVRATVGPAVAQPIPPKGKRVGFRASCSGTASVGLPRSAPPERRSSPSPTATSRSACSRSDLLDWRHGGQAVWFGEGDQSHRTGRRSAVSLHTSGVAGRSATALPPSLLERTSRSGTTSNATICTGMVAQVGRAARCLRRALECVMREATPLLESQRRCHSLFREANQQVCY